MTALCVLCVLRLFGVLGVGVVRVRFPFPRWPGPLPIFPPLVPFFRGTFGFRQFSAQLPTKKFPSVRRICMPSPCNSTMTAAMPQSPHITPITPWPLQS